MEGYLDDHIASLNDEGKEQLQKLIIALSAQAELPSQADLDAQAESDGVIEAGRELLSSVLSNDAESEYACTDCHNFHGDEQGSGADLTGYGSEPWLIEFISNPEHERFYPDSNDRMPAFAENEVDLTANRLTKAEVRLIARWLRGDDRELSR